MNFIYSVSKLSTRQHEFYYVTINYLIGRDKGTLEIPSSKTKKTFFIVIPGLAG